MRDDPERHVEHPYATAWRARDLDAWIAALSTDVVLESPLLREPFVGRDAARELFGALFEIIEAMTITTCLAEGTVAAFFWEARLRSGHTIEGVDLVQSSDAGAVVHVAVYVRPLVALGRFAAALGPALGRRSSAILGTTSAVAAAPLVPMFTALDGVATRIGRRAVRSTRGLA